VATTETDRAAGPFEQHLASPGLLLALLGSAAMSRLREAHTLSGLSPRQFQLLGLLDRAAVSQTELGHSMGIDPSVLVTLLNPLESDGLITRTRDEQDRRRHVVELTRGGRRALDGAARAQAAAEDELFRDLTDKEREQLRKLLGKLRDSLLPGLGGCS
jgi:DNA-binding MarR family transcriptional regulator